MDQKTPPTTVLSASAALHVEINRALKGRGFFIYETRDNEGWCYFVVARDHASARFSAARIAEHTGRKIVSTTLVTPTHGNGEPTD